MKTPTIFILFLTAIITLAAGSAFGVYSGGTGEPNDPYQIATKADLLAMAAATADYNKYFILTADIDMAGEVFTTAIIAVDTVAGNYSFEGTPFTGTFDGDGHKIANFTINGVSNSFLGLFGHVSSGGSLKNLGLENCAVSGASGSYYVGGLVGQNSGSVSNCYSTGQVSGYKCVGGLVGRNTGGSISDCYSTGIVSGSSSWVGGLVGVNYYGSISDCYSTGTVNGGSNSQYVGGLVGFNGGGISNCYSTGTVSVTSGSEYVGGLVGYNWYGSISDCYSTGTVSGSGYVGGLVGYSYGGSIINCYSTGAVSGSSGVGGLVGRNGSSISNCYSTGTVSGSSSVGGLVGHNWYGSISNCYSMGAVGGSSSSVGGLVGYNDGGSVSSSFWDMQTSSQTTSAGGTGKTTAEMKTLSTFTDAGWNFADIWSICEGTNYPRFLWQIPAADFVCPDGVYFDDLAYFFERWLMTDCGLNNDCDGTDMNTDGAVNFIDFALFAQNWLEGL